MIVKVEEKLVDLHGQGTCWRLVVSCCLALLDIFTISYRTFLLSMLNIPKIPIAFGCFRDPPASEGSDPPVATRQ